MEIGIIFHLLFKILMFLFVVTIILIMFFLAYVLYKLYIAKDPLPKIAKIVLSSLYGLSIIALFLFAGMMLLIIIYVCYKVFSLKEPVAFPKQEKSFSI